VQSETIQTLQLFVEKARALNSTRFISFYGEHELMMDANLDQRTGVVQFNPMEMPDSEEFTAFITVLRFFVMKGEKSSFRSLADLLNDHDLSKKWTDIYQAARDKINNFKKADFREQIIHKGSRRLRIN